MATVGLSLDLFDSAFLLLQKAGSLNLDITGQLVRAGPAAQGVGRGLPLSGEMPLSSSHLWVG